MDHDDPRLTAYALGEPLAPGDREAVEAAMSADATLNAAVEELQLVSALIEGTLGTEPLPEAPEVGDIPSLEDVLSGSGTLIPFPSPGSAAPPRQEGGKAAGGGKRRRAAGFTACAGLAAVLVGIGYLAGRGVQPAGPTAGVPSAAAPSPAEAGREDAPSPTPPVGGRAVAESGGGEGTTADPGEEEDPAAPAAADRAAPRRGLAATAGPDPEVLDPSRGDDQDRRQDGGLAEDIGARSHRAGPPPTGAEPPGTDPQQRAEPAVALAPATATEKGDTSAPPAPPTSLGGGRFFDPGDSRHATAPVPVDLGRSSFGLISDRLYSGRIPDPSDVKIEELVNHHPFIPRRPPGRARPFAVEAEVAAAPWDPHRRLVRIAIASHTTPWENRRPSNLVFLVDVSGSMRTEEKLPLVKEGLRRVADRFDTRDRIALVAFSTRSETVLAPTPANRRAAVRTAIDRLEPGGSTVPGNGLQEAIDLARERFVEGGNNRVILCTDGSFPAGALGRTTRQSVAAAARDGVRLTVLGFGVRAAEIPEGEALAHSGGGHFVAVHPGPDAGEVFLREVAGARQVVAEDVQFTLAFNPAKVDAYRWIGSAAPGAAPAAGARSPTGETRTDVNSGTSVTLLYEIVPRIGTRPAGDGPDYPGRPVELLRVSGRCRLPGSPPGDTPLTFVAPVVDRGLPFHRASEDFRFAAAVGGFGMLLADFPGRGEIGLGALRQIAADAQGDDLAGAREDLLALLTRAGLLLEQPSGTQLASARGFGHGHPGRRIPFMGLEVHREKTVFVIDVSSSMRGEKFDQVERSLASALRAMEPTRLFNIVLFHGSTRSYRDGKLVPATSRHVRRALEWLQDQDPEVTGTRGSNPLAGIRRAFKMNPDEIVLLTDGQPSAGVTAPEDILASVRGWQREASRPVAIHTILYRSKEGAPFLKALSRENAGRFRRR